MLFGLILFMFIILLLSEFYRAAPFLFLDYITLQHHIFFSFTKFKR